ncbi:MAG: hypothetical protein JWL71_435 [Acidobacteria bacterium]|nr:hypothetical protein [Acidobacteriota bacterium]
MARKSFTPADIAGHLEDVAARLDAGDRSFGLQTPLSAAALGLSGLGHLAGARLVNILAYQLIPKESASRRYEELEVVQRMERHPPFDVERDTAALRALAAEMRARQ